MVLGLPGDRWFSGRLHIVRLVDETHIANLGIHLWIRESDGCCIPRLVDARRVDWAQDLDRFSHHHRWRRHDLVGKRKAIARRSVVRRSIRSDLVIPISPVIEGDLIR